MSTTTLRFTALDTWFFRESRPMEAIGGSELASVFPPPPRTVLGAVRSAIGDASGVDWKLFATDSNHALRSAIGFADDLGPLALSGPWLHHDGERLYPVPLFLLDKLEDGVTHFARLRIGDAAGTHLGRVRLPELPPGKLGYKAIERAWITRAGLEVLLAGNTLAEDALRRARDLFREESRLGIARDNVRRITDEGLLYQTRHLRPKSDLAIEADITLSAGTQIPLRLVRFGGEGRVAHLAKVEAPAFPTAPGPIADTRGLVIVLLTPARFGTGDDGWLPPGFLSAEYNGERVWKGKIGEVPLTVHAAVLGKAQREGGWDMGNRRPRAVQSLIPAGSCYYVTVDGDIKSVIEKIHGQRIGDDKDLALGRGLVACGLWNANEF